MKKLMVLFVAFTLPLFGGAQDSIQITHVSWAGGVCCSSGDDFMLNIPNSMNQRNIDSVWIFVPGHRIHLSEDVLKSSNKNCIAIFGWSTHAEYETYADKSSVNYYGISVKDIVPQNTYNNAASITLFLSNGKQKESKVKYTSEYLAYP